MDQWQIMHVLLGCVLGAAGTAAWLWPQLKRLRLALLQASGHLARHADHRIIFEAAPAMIWYKDHANKIIRINHAAAETLGKTPAEIEGRSTETFYPDAAKYFADDRDVIASGLAKIGIEEQMRTVRGESRWVRTDKVPHRDADGKIDGVVVFALDITAQKTAEARLRAALDAKGELLAALSHELRTPLTIILGFSELLATGNLTAAMQVNYAGRILHHGRHLTALIDEILDLAKAEHTALPVNLAAVDLVPLVEDILRALDLQAKRKHLALTSSFTTPDPCTFACDPLRLRQILLNVVGNAVKFTKHGNIHVTTTVQAEQLTIDVVDSGIGMTSVEALRLFEPFFQARRIGSGKSGTGLGLALSKKLAQALGGDLILLHTTAGSGSAFRLTLPFAPAPAPTPAPLA